jgi:hypothetical protein
LPESRRWRQAVHPPSFRKVERDHKGAACNEITPSVLPWIGSRQLTQRYGDIPYHPTKDYHRKRRRVGGKRKLYLMPVRD